VAVSADQSSDFYSESTRNRKKENAGAVLDRNVDEFAEHNVLFWTPKQQL
jgi:hypothetical protein